MMIVFYLLEFVDSRHNVDVGTFFLFHFESVCTCIRCESLQIVYKWQINKTKKNRECGQLVFK